jgi:peptide/nickel transport system substrate-binding protein
MQRRYVLSPISVIAALLAVAMLAAIACGGAEEPATAGSQAGSSDAGSQPVQQPTAAEPEATHTPLPASLPTEVVENAVTKDAYPDAEYGGILRRGGYGDPSHYDLMQVSSVSNSFKQMMLLNGLLRYNPLDAGKTIIADLATTWDVSEDGSVWTFPLREGVMFHDGTIMNADDVAASWTRVIDPPAGVVSARKGLYTPFGTAVEVIDPQTVKFTFEKGPPLNYGLNAFALEWHGVFPKAFLEANNYDLKLNGQNAPGTGAFRFLEHAEGEVWKNERFPNYWNEGLPYLDEVWTYPLGSSVNRSAALLAGNVDYAQTVDPAAYELIRNNPEEFEGQPFSSYSYFAIYFNMDREPWNDPKVRRAMWLAIDRDALHEIGGEWFFGYKGGTGWTFPEQAFQLPQDEVDARLVFDRPAAEAEAKRLMEEAGYADGIQNVDLLWRAGPFREAAAQVAQLEFERILGIKSELRAAPFAVWFEELANRNFDITVGGVASPFIDPSAYLNSWYRCGAGENHSNYCNEDFEAIMDQVDVEADPDKRYELVQQAARILDNDPPTIEFWYNRTLAAWRTCVHGIEGKNGALVHNLDRMDTVWMDEECRS